jgi:hypothetical protein
MKRDRAAAPIVTVRDTTGRHPVTPAGATATTADRVRKARRGGGCALCPAPVVVGQRIGRVLVAGRLRWAHVGCVVAAQRRARADLGGRPVVNVHLPGDGPAL